MVAPYLTQEFSEIIQYEISLPETPKLDNFSKMFELPEGAQDTYKEFLQTAQKELIQLFQRPVKMAKTTLSSTSELPQNVQEAYTREIERTTEALGFLDGIFENLSQNKEQKTNLTADIDNKGGLRIKLYEEHRENIGKIFSEGINGVEIVIRTGEKATNETYTPMQLNFRFLSYSKSGMPDEEISSFRVDLHNRTEREVQLDIDLGSAKYLKSVHKRIDSLSADTEEETRERFNVLLSAFTLNFIKQITENNEYIVIGEAHEKYGESQKHLDKALKRSSKMLMPQTQVVEEEEQLTPEQQETAKSLSTIQEILTNKVSSLAVAALADAIDKSSSEDNQTKVLTWLLGKEEVSIERINYLIEFLRTNFSDNGNEPMIWKEAYPDTIKAIRDAALKYLIDLNNEIALNDLDKIISFMAFVPLE